MGMKNDVKLNLAGNNVDAEFEIEAKGTGRRLGQFEFKRKIDWNTNGNNFIASIIGKSSSEKGWFAEKGLNPVDTKINVDFDYNNMNLNANIVKVVAGKRYAVAVKNNNLDFSF